MNKDMALDGEGDFPSMDMRTWKTNMTSVGKMEKQRRLKKQS